LTTSWNFEKARSFFAYEENIASLIHKLKYSGEMTGLDTFKWLSEQSDILDDFDTPDFILPVPLHLKRLRKRGFNQALVLARNIFPRERKKIRHDILIRRTNTPSQMGLSGKKRRQNLTDAFIVATPSEIAGKNILLLDDVFTTGSTANECAKALTSSGCKKVEILTICRADKIYF
jgi:ComF family protein